jgi:YidC/Oxa1 family membrane protein insertase
VESRALLAFALSLAILIGWQVLFVPQQQLMPTGEAVPEQIDVVSEDTSSVGGVADPSAKPLAPTEIPSSSIAEGPEVTKTMETDLYRVAFSSHGGRIKSFVLKDYAADDDVQDLGREMIVADRLLPLGMYWTDEADTVMTDTGVNYRLDVSQVVGGAERITMTADSPDGHRLTKELTLHHGSYVLDLVAKVSSTAPKTIGLAWTRRISDGGSRLAGTEGPTGFIDQDLETESGSGLDEPVQHSGTTSWAGYTDHYFLAAFYPSVPTALRLVATARNGEAQATLWSDDGSGRAEFGLFIGPKSIDLLKSVGHDLEEALDLGFFAVIARPLLWLLLKLHIVTGNYGWAIILLTVGIRVVFYPVNQKQAKAMKAMQRIQPELKKIQEKYKDDREKLNQEMMETYRRHKVNPLAGCLPMVIQLPVFLGLYNVLLAAIELRGAPFVGWITDLSQPDRLGALAVPFVSPAGIPVMTLLMGASMLIQQKMMPAGGDPTQQRMMMFLPLIFTVMFINFPSGLVLYWFANNMMSIGQQYLTNRSTA